MSRATEAQQKYIKTRYKKMFILKKLINGNWTEFYRTSNLDYAFNRAAMALGGDCKEVKICDTNGNELYHTI